MPSTLASALTALFSLSLATALASATHTATIVVEASHGGAGEDLTNTTLTVPLTAAYTNSKVLGEVSTLYLTGSSGVSLTSITCGAYFNANGTGPIGPTFNSSEPRFLSTNTVPVGSIVCVSSSISFAPEPIGPGGPSPLSTTAGMSSTTTNNLTRTLGSKTTTVGGGAVTSTLVKTASASGGGGGMTKSTITSVVSATGSASSGALASNGPSATTSGQPTLASGNSNSAVSRGLGSEFFGVLALCGFGVAFVL